MALRLVGFWAARVNQTVLSIGGGDGVLKPAFDAALPGGVEAVDLGRAASRVQAFWILLRLLRRIPVDVIVIHFFGVHHVLVACAARFARVPVVAAWAGNPAPRTKASRLKWALVLAASRVSGCRVVACSDFVARSLRELPVGRRAVAAVIPYGSITGELEAAAAEARRSKAAGRKVVGMVARLDIIKDHVTLLRAMQLVAARCADCELWIVGDGDRRETLEAEAEHLGLPGCTRFLGVRTDVPALLGGMDVYAFSTTIDEGFGIALIEAMAAGVPIVATDVPACREVLDGGRAGLLVPAFDAQKLADGVLRLIEEPAFADHLARTARDHVRERYDLQSCSESWLAVLDRPSAGSSQDNHPAN